MKCLLLIESGFVLGILLIARRGLRTRTVRIADRLKFSVIIKYSKALHEQTDRHTDIAVLI